MKKITKEQIELWKKKHGKVFEIKVEDKHCFLKKPDRQTLSFAMTMAQTDPLGFTEAILENCWLGGDEAIKTEDSLFLAASAKIDGILEVKQAELKKH